MKNIFELASRQNVFIEMRGLFDAYQLGTLPLTSENGFNLDILAQGVNILLRAVTGSFVNPNHARGNLELQLALIKHVIAYKLRLENSNGV